MVQTQKSPNEQHKIAGVPHMLPKITICYRDFEDRCPSRESNDRACAKMHAPWHLVPVGTCGVPGKKFAKDMANQSSNYIVIGALSQTNVTVSPSVRQPPPVRQVLVTPLSRLQQAQQLMSTRTQPIVNPPIKKVMLKAVNRGSKVKEPKTFTQRCKTRSYDILCCSQVSN